MECPAGRYALSGLVILTVLLALTRCVGQAEPETIDRKTAEGDSDSTYFIKGRVVEADDDASVPSIWSMGNIVESAEVRRGLGDVPVLFGTEDGALRIEVRSASDGTFEIGPFHLPSSNALTYITVSPASHSGVRLSGVKFVDHVARPLFELPAAWCEGQRGSVE